VRRSEPRRLHDSTREPEVLLRQPQPTCSRDRDSVAAFSEQDLPPRQRHTKTSRPTLFARQALSPAQTRSPRRIGRKVRSRGDGELDRLTRTEGSRRSNGGIEAMNPQDFVGSVASTTRLDGRLRLLHDCRSDRGFLGTSPNQEQDSNCSETLYIAAPPSRSRTLPPTCSRQHRHFLLGGVKQKVAVVSYDCFGVRDREPENHGNSFLLGAQDLRINLLGIMRTGCAKPATRQGHNIGPFGPTPEQAHRAVRMWKADSEGLNQASTADQTQ